MFSVEDLIALSQWYLISFGKILELVHPDNLDTKDPDIFLTWFCSLIFLQIISGQNHDMFVKPTLPILCELQYTLQWWHIFIRLQCWIIMTSHEWYRLLKAVWSDLELRLQMTRSSEWMKACDVIVISWLVSDVFLISAFVRDASDVPTMQHGFCTVTTSYDSRSVQKWWKNEVNYWTTLS